MPEPRDELIALNHRNYVVQRHELTPPQYAILRSIFAGETLGQAITAATQITLDDEQLVPQICEWFRAWTAAGFVRSARMP